MSNIPRYVNKEEGPKIIIIGAGKLGQEAVGIYGKHRVAFFADNDRRKTGTYIDGIEVVPVTELKSYDTAYDLVICCQHITELVAQLKQLGVRKFYTR